jgi:hypothetical protein
MLLTNKLPARVMAVVAAAALVAGAGAGAGYSAGKITGGQIAKETIKSKNIKNGSIQTKDLNPTAVTELKGTPAPPTSGFAKYIANSGANLAAGYQTLATLNVTASKNYLFTAVVGFQNNDTNAQLTYCRVVSGTNIGAETTQAVEGGLEGSSDDLVVTGALTAAQTANGQLALLCQVNSGDPDFAVDEIQIIANEVTNLSVQP